MHNMKSDYIASHTRLATGDGARSWMAHPRLSASADGRKGIRNVVAVAYLVECAHHVARAIVTKSE
jgi:hypothetical protein